MDQVEALLALVAACIGFALLARRLAVPYAVILVLGGMLLAVAPGVPEYRLDPELALALFLPPLLQASAWRTDWRAFRSALVPILALALGAVLFTAFCVAWVAKLLLPDLPWSVAIALGAIVAPPDAVAAEAVLQRLNLPRRIVTVLQGESLVNDASSLVLYRLAVAAALAGADLAPAEGAASFLALGLGGIAVGWAVGRGAIEAFRRLDDPQLEVTTSFLAAYAAYLAGEALGVSGVLAVVTAGMLMGRAQHTLLTSRSRMGAQAVWRFVEFLLNSLVFILIGLQLNHVLERIADRGTGQLLAIGGAIAATVILSRFLWVFPAAWLMPQRMRQAAGEPPRNWRHTAVIGWAGMRGVVSLAAALALPDEIPERDLLVFLAFVAILATLVLQGTTLEWVIRTLGVEAPAHDGGIAPDEAEGRRIIAAAALSAIEQFLDDPLEGAIARDILPEYQDRAGHLHRTASNRGAAAAERSARRRLRLAALEAGREALIAHAMAGDLHAEGLQKLEQELDLEELRVRAVLGDERSEAEKAAARARRHRARPA
ncbi:Na+/H+ antiporter [Paracraurococcus ruber]|uniref:Na+/H+ antiporter n=1 Tax=Paracraurococcus ruber TaxID=77675 RepID=A0ABS1CVA9_9PROT|nr:Na+/H+ antiporter [Paracraurococcus ruber]MBK1658454.1 Na+/H+ antiporter [Paracraurococcus ruber]TDG32125.1 Na+/H+ antiporter [Paracraurococcus ruber]